MFKKLGTYLRSRLPSLRQTGFRQNFLNALPFWIGAFVTGILAVAFARLFALAEDGTDYIFHAGKGWLLLVTPICFLLSWALVARFAPYAKGSGIPQVSAAIELSTPRDAYKVNKLLSVRIIFIKTLSVLLMALGGGAIGREGPTVQIAGAVFKKINDWLPAWYPKISKKNMIVTGAATGLAAAFNTPLGGIVFAIEELTKMHFSYFKSALLTGVIIAGLTALNILGPYLYLGYPSLKGVTFWVIIAILPVAILCGFGGGMMAKLVLFCLRWKKKCRRNAEKILFVLLCGVAVAALGVFVNVNSFGSGKDLMNSALFTTNKHMAWYLPILRFITPVISFSAGGAGGIFAPALSAGASIGGVLAGWFGLAGGSANLVILCGMTAFLTGITRSPFTSTILVLEMTDANNIIFYLMIAGLVANLIAAFTDRHSFYEHLKVQYMRELEGSEAGRFISGN